MSHGADKVDAPVARRWVRRFLQPGSSSMVLARVYNLNPTKTKRVWLGLAFEPGFPVCAEIENASGRACMRLCMDDFLALFDPAWVQKTNRHMMEPFAQPTPCQRNKNSTFRLVQMRQQDPALKIASCGKAASCTMGAISFATLQELSPLLQDVCAQLHHVSTSGYLEMCFMTFLNQLCAKVPHALTCDRDAKEVVFKHTIAVMENLHFPHPCLDFLMETAFTLSGHLAKIVLHVVNDTLLDSVKPETCQGEGQERHVDKF